MAQGVLKWIWRTWRGLPCIGHSEPSAGRLFVVMIVASMWFGLCMALHVLFHPSHGYHKQVVASVVKVPLLLVVAVALVFPLLYGLTRLLQVQLRSRIMWQLAVAAVTATALTLAVLGPVIIVCCAVNNYSVVVLVSYGCFLIAGLVGALFFNRALAALYREGRAGEAMLGLKTWPIAAVSAHPTAPRLLLAPIVKTSAALRQMRYLTFGWICLFGVTAGQVGWMMRPFVGWTGQPFEWFRTERTTIFEQVYYECVNLFYGGGAHFPDATSLPQPSSAKNVEALPTTRSASEIQKSE